MSKTFSKLLAGGVRLLTGWQGAERAARNRLQVRGLLTDTYTIPTDKGPLKLVCTDRREVHYARHFFEREPSTLNWIDGFDAPCTFWDVGANTGMYALYAGLNPDVTVMAFEPGAASFAALYRNIHANDLDGRVQGLCLGFYDRNTLSRLSMDSFEAGGAMHTFGDDVSNAAKAFAETVPSLTMDAFRELYNVPAPTYLKIDVDGVEEEILAGAAETLKDPDLRAVLIEISTDDAARGERLAARLTDAGLTNREDFPEDHNAIFRR